MSHSEEFESEDNSNEQSSAGNEDVLDVRILPSKPNQPKINFPLRSFGKQRRGFSVHWYEKYPWIHYLDNEDAVLCFYCATAVKSKMPLNGYVDSVFTKCGFNNWKKAIDRFVKHEKSASHCHAVSMVIAASKECMDVGSKLSRAYEEKRAQNRKCLLAIISTVRFLARQGLALRGAHIDGNGEADSNFMQLLFLRNKDIPDLDKWLQRAQDRFTSHDIQIELLKIMALTVLRSIATRISGKLFTILVDETTDISNIEQLVFCIRFVDDDLHCHEEFIGLHSMENTSAETITHTIEDILLRLSLPLQKCRGQCYDGASSMSGCKTGVSTSLLRKEPRALYTHCYGHALNLAIQESSKSQHNSLRHDGHYRSDDQTY